MAIYARLENGTYAEVTGVYKTDGTEITEIFQGERLVYSATNEIYGTVPLYYDGLGYELIDYLISGNTVQDGTPSPDAPVEVQGCGVRTGNLFDSNALEQGGIVDATGVDAVSTTRVRSAYIALEGGTRYSFDINDDTMVVRNVYYYDAQKQWLGRSSRYGQNSDFFDFPNDGKYIRLVVQYAQDAQDITVSAVKAGNLMLNLGSTALPYEPYGIKLDISSGGENLAWTGWAQDFVSRINSAARASIVSDEGRECLRYDVSVGYRQYDTKYIFKTEWKENTRYSISFYGKRPTGMTATTVARLFYTDDTFKKINVPAAGVGNYVRYAVVSAAGKTIKSLCAEYSSGSFIIDINTFMVNEGSTAKPYSPYNRTTTPIYLGQCESTRRVKKLVLTGEENITSSHTDIGLYNIPVTDYLKIVATTTNVCSHYKASINVNGWSDVTDMSCCFYGNTSSPSKLLYIRDTSYTSIADFKAYLAQQYAAGTPVTVWYVLAEPETAVVNEPLMKIGDYADTVSAAQAGVAIPTVNGANVLDMASTVKPSEVYIKGKDIKPTGYGQLTDVNGVNILDKDGRPIYVHGQ